MDDITSSRLDKLFNIEPDHRSQVQIEEMTELLLKTQLFESISKYIDMPAAVEACARKMRLRGAKSGQTIYKIGQEAKEFFFIVKGLVSVSAPHIVHLANSAKKRHSVRYSIMPLSKTTKTAEPQGQMKGYKDERPHEVSTLGPGYSCGDTAILRNTPFLLECVAAEDLLMAYLSKLEFNSCMRRVQERRFSEKIQFLGSLVHFKHLTSRGLYRLAHSFHYKTYRKNQLVYSEGDAPESVFIIMSGEFEFLKTIIGRTRGPIISTLRRSISRRRNLKVFTKAPKEFFGQEDLYENRKRFATCRCGSNKGEVFYIDLAEFETLVMPSPAGEILRNQHNLLENFQQELIEKSTHIEESLMAYKTEDNSRVMNASSSRVIAYSGSPQSRNLSPSRTEDNLHKKFSIPRSIESSRTLDVSGGTSKVHSSSPLKSSTTVSNLHPFLSAVPSVRRKRTEVQSKLQDSISEIRKQLLKPPLRALKSSPVWTKLKDRTLMNLKLTSNSREESIKQLLKRKWD